MNRLLIMVSTVLLLLSAGCAPKYPENADLVLGPGTEAAGVYDSSVTATLRGHDGRQYQEVILYQLGSKPAVRISNRSAPHLLVAERLVNGFEQQGVTFDRPAPVHIQVNVNDLRATVTRPKVLYVTEAISRVELAIGKSGSTLSKKYRREANRESVGRPEVEELEVLLSEQLEDIVKQILQDREVNEMIGR